MQLNSWESKPGTSCYTITKNDILLFVKTYFFYDHYRAVFLIHGNSYEIPGKISSFSDKFLLIQNELAE